MGLFRRNRQKNNVANDPPSPPPQAAPLVEEPKFTVVILEFPPNFDPSTGITAPVNRRIMFQHETDSVFSCLSVCSCRMQHGRRRPECCLECNDMKEAMNNSTSNTRRTTKDEGTDPESADQPVAKTDESEQVSTTKKEKQGPTIGLFSRIVAPVSSSTRIKLITPTSSSLLTPPPSSPRKHPHKKSPSADTGFFSKNHIYSSSGHQSQTLTAESLSLDHELS